MIQDRMPQTLEFHISIFFGLYGNHGPVLFDRKILRKNLELVLKRERDKGEILWMRNNVVELRL